MHALFNHINQYGEISTGEFEYLLSHFVYKRIRKRHFLQQEGTITTDMAYLLKGAMRQYYTDEKGVDHILSLYIENSWIGDRESIATCSPSLYCIDAWEDCEVLVISKENILHLRKKIQAFNTLLLILDEVNMIQIQRRLTYSLCFSAAMRYRSFVDNYPELATRFPQHIIASYLGITKDTLSRIGRKLRKKD